VRKYTKFFIGLVVMILAVLGFVTHAPNKKARYHIALITPVTHPALQRIEHSFKQTLEALIQQPIACTTYNAQGKRTLMHAQVADALADNYDLIVTFAAAPTLMTYTLAAKMGSTVPIVFAAVAQPERNGIIQTRAITGVVEVYNPYEQVRALRFFKPDCKRVLIIYDPTQTSELRRDAQMISELLQRNRVQVRLCEVMGVADLSARASGLLDSIDTVLVLIDNTVVSGIDVLIKLCNQRGISLVASDLDSGIKGAALAVGVHQDQYGVLAAHQAFEILVNKKPATQIPYHVLNDQLVQINTKTMQAQHLTTASVINALSQESVGEGVLCVHLS